MRSKMENFVGRSFGHWTVISNSFRKGRATYCACQCVCGETRDVWVADLKRGISTQCGCKSKQHRAALRKIDGAYEKSGISYAVYKSRAKRKGIEFSVSEVEFHKIVTSECFYCGKSGKEEINGIDRYDNSFGYNLENSVPCCTSCNLSKGVLSYTSFRDLIERIYRTKCLAPLVNVNAPSEHFNYLI